MRETIDASQVELIAADTPPTEPVQEVVGAALKSPKSTTVRFARPSTNVYFDSPPPVAESSSEDAEVVPGGLESIEVGGSMTSIQSFHSALDVLPPPSIDLERTFRHMVARRVEREFGGVKTPPQTRAFLVLISFSVLGLGMVHFSTLDSVVSGRGDNTTDADDRATGFNIHISFGVHNALVLVLALFLFFLAQQIAEVVRTTIYVVLVGMLTYIGVQVACSVRECDDSSLYWYQTSIQSITILTVFCCYVWFKFNISVYPTAVLRGWCCARNISWWWSIAPTRELMTFAYRPGLFTKVTPCIEWAYRLLRVPPSHFSYHGEIDEDGRPDGVGIWTDSARNGETLEGWWDHGRPIGPYHASEYASGYATACVRIAYASIRGETTIEDYWYSAPRSQSGLKWGVCAIECSTAGRFFKHLPALTPIVDPEGATAEALDVEWCLEQLKPTIQVGAAELGPETLTVTATHAGLNVTGYERDPGFDDASLQIHIRYPPTAGVRRLTSASSVASPGFHAPSAAVATAPEDAEAGGWASPSEAGGLASPSEAGSAPPSRALRAMRRGPRHTTFSLLEHNTAADEESLRSEEETVRKYFGAEIGPGLEVIGYTPTAEKGFEAVVFLHGFNCPVSDALKLIGQLWTLSDFPPHVKPFVFGWPGGRDVGYFTSCKRAHDPQIARDFRDFIASLAKAECSKVHVIAHSMGARLFLSTLTELQSVITKAADYSFRKKPHGQGAAASSGGTSPLRKPTTRTIRRSVVRREQDETVPLATVLLMNPDSPLDKFIAKDYPLLREMCEHITLYADHSDAALWWSEQLHRQKSLGRNPAALVRKLEPGQTPSERSTPSPVDRRSSQELHGVHVVRFATPPMDEHASTTKRSAEAASEEETEYLDMDVIDVSWMDNNVHSMRHNFFNVNRWMIDDLRDIILNEKRAKLRTARMTNRFGNVWAFLAAPSYVVNP